MARSARRMGARRFRTREVRDHLSHPVDVLGVPDACAGARSEALEGEEIFRFVHDVFGAAAHVEHAHELIPHDDRDDHGRGERRVLVLEPRVFRVIRRAGEEKWFTMLSSVSGYPLSQPLPQVENLDVGVTAYGTHHEILLFRIKEHEGCSIAAERLHAHLRDAVENALKVRFDADDMADIGERAEAVRMLTNAPGQCFLLELLVQLNYSTLPPGQGSDEGRNGKGEAHDKYQERFRSRP